MGRGGGVANHYTLLGIRVCHLGNAKDRMREQPNFVGDLEAAYGENAELALGGVVVLLLRRSSPFRRSFLGWVAESASLDIEAEQAWEVFGERPLHNRRGFIDIVLESPTLSIWIESKTNSRVKPAQLRRFIAESHRVMYGTMGDPITAVPLSEFDRVPKSKPVVVLLVSGCEQKLPEDFHSWKEAFARLGCGSCWAGEPGYLRWTDLMPYVQRAVPEMETCERRIALDLVDWWREFSGRYGNASDPNAA